MKIRGIQEVKAKNCVVPSSSGDQHGLSLALAMNVGLKKASHFA